MNPGARPTTRQPATKADAPTQKGTNDYINITL